MRERKRPGRFWSYSAGQRGLNAVRVYNRAGTAVIQIEWYDDEGRHQKSLSTSTGHPITDRTLARDIADAVAEAQAKKRNDGALTVFKRMKVATDRIQRER